MNQLFDTLCIKKQSFHQMLQRKEKHLSQMEQTLFLANKIRIDHPCMSVRTIYFKIQPQGIGRDKFETYCYECGYRVKKHKNFRTTTDS